MIDSILNRIIYGTPNPVVTFPIVEAGKKLLPLALLFDLLTLYLFYRH